MRNTPVPSGVVDRVNGDWVAAEIAHFVIVIFRRYRTEVRQIFTARRYASAVYAVVVCLSFTRRYCIETAKPRIRQTTQHDSPVTVVFFRQRSRRNLNGITPLRGRQTQVHKVKIGHFRQITHYISKTVWDICIISINVE